MLLKNISQLIVMILAMLTPYVYLRKYKQSQEVPKIRDLPALEVIPEMIGRAAEMGAKCLWSPGIRKSVDARVICGLSILEKVSELAVEKGSSVVSVTAGPVLMPLIEDAMITGFTNIGHPEMRPDVRFLTDQQFAYCAGVMGIMERENCQANFYTGGWADEALPISAAGNAIGAMQIAGDTNMYQLPYFVCTCDYVMIAEEFLVSGAVLSQDIELLGGIIGSDVLKYILIALGILGIVATSMGSDIIIQLLSF